MDVNKKNTAVVILNYNGVKWLKLFLPNVIENSQEDADVIVIDNASTDESIAFLQKEFPKIQVVLLPENYGFAGGYNQGLKELDYTYLVLLNSDVEVSKDWVKAPIKLLEDNPNIAACQPKILAYNDKKSFEYAGASGGFIDKYGYAFCRGRMVDELELDKGQYQDAIPIFWATGACMFIRSEIYNKMGGFDESFFAHFEEIDLCWRIKNEGHAIYCEPESTVYHVGGGTLNSDSPRKTFLNFRNSLSMLYKNLPKKKVFPIIFIRLILDGLIGIKFLLSGKISHTLAIIKGHFAFYGRISELKKKRTQASQYPSETFLGNLITEYILKGNKSFPKLNPERFKK
jgi:GT2 family glycosyltransferase